MASLRLSSRFGILNVMDASPDFDSSDDEVKESAKQQNQTQGKGNKDGRASSNNSNSADHGTSANAKKRGKKKKKQQTAELRDIAFNKIPTVPKSTAPAVPPTSPPARLPPGLAPPDSTSVPPINMLQQLVGNPMQWEEWKRKDSGVVRDQFEDDLQKAILASKIEFEHQQEFLKEVDNVPDDSSSNLPPGVNRKERRKHLQGKDKPHPMSLQEFQTAPTNGGLDDISIPKKPDPDPEYFDRIEKDAAEIISKEERKNLRKKNQKLAAENARRVQFEDNLEKRDQEIEEMKAAMEKMKEELAQVKKRNKQLCFILAQGEMKDKAEVLKQVDDLTAVKDELTAEVAELHGALEQERSKVSTMKAAILRLQHEKKK